jgi:RHS repeat-associated protein
MFKLLECHRDGRPRAIVEGGQVFWLHWDHVLRPVLATDATGAVVWAARYLPFGGIDAVAVDTGALTQTLRFPGQWFQAETGLHQNWMRDYDPTLGRYLQADPLGLVDGPSVYGYVKQSPVRYVDPDGRDALEAVGAVALADLLILEPTDIALPAKLLGYCVATVGAIFIDLVTAAPACGCGGGDEDKCAEKREIEETLCYSFANLVGGGRSAKQNQALCLKSAFRGEVQCRQGVPEPEREPLFGVDTPL